MKQLRLCMIGFGVVGQGLAELLAAKRAMLQHNYGRDLTLVGVANVRHGFIYCEDGLDIPTLLELAAANRPLTDHPAIQHWANPLDGLQAIRADVLVEVTSTNLHDAEPALSYIRTALSQGMHVVTANKGPVALAGPELFALAQQHNAQLRLEATIMAGTPVISTICEGMAGTSIQAIHGILNGTTNYILSAMSTGRDYADVLAEAQAEGYAEANPTFDVEGYDALAKALILSYLAFGHPLKPEQVTRQGITTLTKTAIQRASDEGKRIKLLVSLRRRSDQDTTAQNSPLAAKIEPVALPLSDPLAHIDGVMNAITIQTDTLGAVTITGPGAGRLQTGQGLLSDLLAL